MMVTWNLRSVICKVLYIYVCIEFYQDFKGILNSLEPHIIKNLCLSTKS